MGTGWWWMGGVHRSRVEVTCRGYVQRLCAEVTSPPSRAADFTPTQLKAAGCSAAQLRAAGFSLHSFRTSGFTAAQLIAAGVELQHLKAAHYSAQVGLCLPPRAIQNPVPSHTVPIVSLRPDPWAISTPPHLPHRMHALARVMLASSPRSYTTPPCLSHLTQSMHQPRTHAGCPATRRRWLHGSTAQRSWVQAASPPRHWILA